MARIILPLLLLVSGCSSLAPREDWSRRDTKLEIAFQAINAMDAYSTTNIRNHPDIREGHPITRTFLGDEPEVGETVAFFAVNGFLHYLLSRYLHTDARPWFQGFTIGVSGAAVLRNCDLDLC